MGWLDFFKEKLLSKKLEEIYLKDADKFLQENKKKLYQEAEEDFKEYLEDIGSSLDELKKEASELEKAEPKDKDKVAPKVLNIVLSHRKNYIRQLNRFLDKELPEKIDPEKTFLFYSEIDENLKELAKSTAKSFGAVQHLFYDNAEKIKKYLSDINKRAKDIKDSAEKKALSYISRSEKLLKDIREYSKLKKELSEKIIFLDKRLKSKDSEIEKLKAEKESSKKSKKFSEKQELKQRLTDIEDKISNLKNRALSTLSSMERPLRKYQKTALENGEVIEDYLKDRFKALISDKELKIIDVIRDVKKAISGDSIKIDRKEKVLKKLDDISKESLSKLQKEYHELERSKKETIEKIKSNDIDTVIHKYKEKIEKAVNERENIEKELNSVKREKESYDIDEMIKKLEKYLAKISKKEIKIIR